jgi:HSP20 family protein
MAGGAMAVDKFNFPHMFFLPDIRHEDDVWQPRADVYRTHDGWLVKLELAGVRPDEIRLATEGATLIIQGARRDEHCHQGMGCHCMEISYSSFERVVKLPGLSGSAEVATSYVDGMLLVRIKTGNRS